ncbi:hypothetical protein BC830DRAFT_1091333 [Chytriomyces sp. MP71]|nr:hypothetical protein BC830DRAFT_1091333 [Chytriomyces sp. MP71]
MSLAFPASVAEDQATTKRIDKLMKKAKAFLDEKQKAKSRLTSLYGFLEGITPFTMTSNIILSSPTSNTSAPSATVIDVSQQNDAIIDQQILVKFFAENCGQVLNVLCEGFNIQIDKLKGKEKNAQGANKDLSDLVKIITVFRKFLIHIPDKLENGWEALAIYKIVQSLLISNNHPRLRIEGFKLLLVWINNQPFNFLNLENTNQPSIYHLIQQLYSSAINWSVFEAPPLPAPIDLAKSDCMGTDRVPGLGGAEPGSGSFRQRMPPTEKADDSLILFPSPSYPTEADSIELLDEILSNLQYLGNLCCVPGFGPNSSSPTGYPMLHAAYNHTSAVKSGFTSSPATIQWTLLLHTISAEPSFLEKAVANRAAFAALVAQWNMFKRAFFPILFPAVFAKLNGCNVDGFQHCPTEVLQSILVFTIRQALDVGVTTATLESGSQIPFQMTQDICNRVCKVFQLVLLNEVENREFIHETIRQGLLVPWINSDLSRYSMFILRNLVFAPVDDRNPFLTPEIISDASEDKNVSFDTMNIFLRRYIRYIQLLFLDKKDYVEYVDQQMILWREGFSYLRLISLELYQLQLCPKTWDCLLSTTSVIIEHILCRPNKYAGVASPPDADEICDLALETLFCVWIRSGTSSEISWQILKEILSKCIRWRQTIGQYVKTLGKLTKALSSRIFGIDVDHVVKEDIDTKTSQRLRAASIYAAKVKSSTASVSSQTSYKSGRILAQSPLAESPDLYENEAKLTEMTQSILNHTKFDKAAFQSTMSTDDVEVEYCASPASSLRRIDQIMRRSEPPHMHNMKDSTRVSNSSIGSLLSVEGSNERFVDKSYQLFSATFKPPPLSPFLQTKLENFTNIMSLTANWLPEWTYILWKNMLCILGDINKIAPAVHHADVIRCLTSIADIFEKIRIIQPYNGVIMPPLFEFASWLFKACDLPSDYIESKELAYGSICRIMSRRHDQDLPSDALPQFYRVMLKGLETDDYKIVSSIILNSTSIFTVVLPGCHILIPSFVKAIKFLFLTNAKESPLISEHVRESSIKILISLLTAPNWKTSVIEPPILKKVDAGMQMDKLKSTSASSLISNNHSKSLSLFDYLDGYADNNQKLRIKVKDMMLELIKQERDSLRAKKNLDHIILLWGTVSLTFEEMVASLSPSPEIIDGGIDCLIDHLTMIKSDPVSTSIEGLSLFAKESLILDFILDTETISKVITKLVAAVTEHLLFQHNPRENREFIVCKLLYCLTGWIMIQAADILSQFKMALMIFDIFEQVLKESEADTEVPSDFSSAALQKIQKLDASLYGSASRLTTGKHEKSTLGNTDDYVDSNLLKVTVENCLAHILHNYKNFSPPFGSVQTNSQIFESGLYDDRVGLERILLFGVNEDSILSCSDKIDEPTERLKTQVISRNTTGRYVWESCVLFDNDTTEYDVSVKFESKSFDLDIVDIELEDIFTRTSAEKEHVTDKLSDLLLRIGENYHDCLLYTDLRLNEAAPMLPSTLADVLSVEADIRDHLSQESQVSTSFIPISLKNPRNSDLLKHVSCSEEIMKFTSFSRLFLSQLGHFNFDSLKEGYFVQISKSSALSRDVRGLDKKFGREVIKVAVIYVGPGQEDESTILRNHNASNEYHEFVASLGWEVEISSHNGYLGGLEKNLTSGSKALYYCDHSVEMIFHDVLKMPIDTLDPKQVKKKRHIGNDHVHIVWNEHYRDYRKNTIGGDFGNAQIVVTPMLNDLYAITVIRDQKLAPFGPLQSHTIISKPSLGSLVRSTAINAYRKALAPGQRLKLHPHPYSQRSNDITTILTRHKSAKFTFEHYLNSFF